MAQLRNIDPNAIAIQQREPNRRRYWHAPFPATVIAAGAVATLQMGPQELYRTERAFLNSALAGDFNVTQLFVGQKNQLLVAGEINGSVFSEVAIRSFLNLDTANIGNTISLSLRNDGLVDVAPRPDLLGTAAV
jgi:negative regulator of sigma E activity